VLTLNKLVILASVAAAFVSTAASAATNLVVNGNFEQTTLTSKGSFQNNVTGWSGGNGLVSLDTPGSATTAGTGPGNNYAVYGPFANTSPAGGNFVQMDGDSNYSSPIYQQINGLTIGQTYTLNFYQAAGQQQGFDGATTERWAVYFTNDPSTAVAQLSDKYSLVSHGVGAWQLQTMTLTATATSEYLAFLAVGTPNGTPPTSFLDGVSLTAAVPEPATWGMMIVGFAAMGVAARRRRQVLATA
jgi:hypothetical protein